MTGYPWLSTVSDKFWVILNYSKVVWDINTKFLPVLVLIRIQLFTKFGTSSCTQNFKRAWQAHFLTHTHATQEICCLLADVQIILVSLFEFFDYIKVAKNAGAFLSRCSELLGLSLFLCYFSYTSSILLESPYLCGSESTEKLLQSN